MPPARPIIPARAENPIGLTGSGSGVTEASWDSSAGSQSTGADEHRLRAFGFCWIVHLFRMAGIAGVQAGIEGMIGYSVCRRDLYLLMILTWQSIHETPF